MTYYYAFKGQNSNWGTPNPQTGMYNTFGKLKAFKTRAKRDEYCNTVRLDGYEFVRKCSKSSARQFTLGMSVASYEEMLAYLNLEAE